MQTVNPVSGAAGYTTPAVGSGADENSGLKAPEGQVGTTAVREISVPRNIQPPSMGASSAVMIVQRSASVVAAQMVDADFQLPAGHTFRPYFCISPRANEEIVADAFQSEDRQAQVIAELSMSEKRARQRFHERFEYRLVNYGYACTAESPDDKQVSNCGVFTRLSVKAGQVLGIYSGVAYLLRKSGWMGFSKGEVEKVHSAFRRGMPDFMSCHRNLCASVRGNSFNQRIVSNYTLKGNCADELYLVHIAPDNNHFTPMHFVNSANTQDHVNAVIVPVAVAISGMQFVVPAFVSTRNIQIGEEILSDYLTLTSPYCHSKQSITTSAATKRLEYDRIAQEMISLTRGLNCLVPDKLPISPFVAAPMICVSEIASKYWRKHWKKTSCR